ncbi:uncharacterized protein LOC106667493 [Cimex lectularius]|uniref:Uncharacterized protein n=1 Tax=Cimex lectularius TaxID=79782 RepID=A0A8I6RR17_CIMLE|nr:uncharacterized protein LOC106667493 [Cimex lectularius]
MELVLVLLLTLPGLNAATVRDIVRIEHFGNCKNVVRGKHNYYDNITLISLGRGSYGVNTDYEVIMSAKKILATYEVFKCPSNSATNCEQFGNFKHNDFCPKLEEKGQFWSPIFENTRPPLKCPFKKITYQLRNATFDVHTLLTFVKFIPDFSNFYWLTKTYYWTTPGKQMMECKSVVFKTTKIRV